MAGIKGKVTKAKKPGAKAVYLSDVFGMWPENGNIHITFLKDKQQFHTSVSPKDGMLFEFFRMMYGYANEFGEQTVEESSP